MNSLHGHETVLVAEDEDTVRELTTRHLRGLGYTVLAAEDGRSALAAAEKYQGPIDLLIADVVMPRMSGSTLASQLAAERPALKVLYVSGYLERSDTAQDLISPSAAFLHKPFTPEVLARKVREILDAGASAASH